MYHEYVPWSLNDTFRECTGVEYIDKVTLATSYLMVSRGAPAVQYIEAEEKLYIFML